MDFRKKSNHILLSVMRLVSEKMSSDPATRFNYYQNLTNLRNQFLDHDSGRNFSELDHVKAFLVLFATDETAPAANRMFTSAVHELKEGSIISITLAPRDWWLPPLVTSITVLEKGSFNSETFEVSKC